MAEDSVKIAVIGCGYLGAVHAACMASLGHDVIGIDVDANKIARLQAGEAPFFEPQLNELLVEGQSASSLSFAHSSTHASEADVIFICVGTPQREGDYAANLDYLDAAFRSAAAVAKEGALLVGKSTVPVGTAERLRREIALTRPDLTVMWNPEFLREGHAVSDTLGPDRLVYGVANGDDEAVERLDAVYARLLSEGTPRLIVNLPTAELVKTAANSFLATKISFINAMAELCEASGADVTLLADAIGRDERIGRRFLNAGIGFGGGCLPKDIRAFSARAGEIGADEALTFLREIDLINLRRRNRAVEAIAAMCGGSLLGKRIGVLGASFKPESDDVRDSPALSIAQQLQLQGASVRVYDPEAMENASRRFPELRYVADWQSAVAGADVVAVLTEWTQFTELSPEALSTHVRSQALFDGRNAFDPATFREAGWVYRGVGR
ncbi:UDP-glucose/GDP-mannose dehydrogenase family protein [Falsarthrobacter nasiphocae]|uniref:UDP-glucose 6-dehydrogenase n=1 Tax=Falsarthrobacter nasiphocae TaxID=189863 RepID=A0AAE3YG94_9MICC|nr:UDP-glucose/GDP-mannose dehydrogenase family protein [Falsarthrobacter nasiphocae]MDR6891604.1 UDPglucose 6-dehydrogenase [Falsarthrobacter nasiphocae]